MKLPEPDSFTDSDMLFLYENDLRGLFNSDSKSLTRFYFETRFRQIIKILTRFCVKGKSKVLDVGCAQGNFTLTSSSQGWYSVGLDLKSSFLRYAKMKAEAHEKKNVEFICASAYFLPFRSEVFDVIILGEILEHLFRPQKGLLEARKSLKPSGYCLITTPNAERWSPKLRIVKILNFYSKTEFTMKKRGKEMECKPNEHVFEFSKFELLNLVLNLGFKVEKFRFFNFIGYVESKFLKLPLPTSLLRSIELAVLNLPLIGHKLAFELLVVCKVSDKTQSF